MDVFDRAQLLEMAERERLIAAARQKVTCGEAAEQCACGAAISAERRKALPGVRMCVECARVLERRNGLLKRA